MLLLHYQGKKKESSGGEIGGIVFLDHCSWYALVIDGESGKGVARKSIII